MEVRFRFDFEGSKIILHEPSVAILAGDWPRGFVP